MPKVLVKRSDVDDQYIATADEFSATIDRGERKSPRSVELLLFGLGACTISTVAHYMQRKGLATENLAIELSANLNEKENFYEQLNVTLHFDDSVPEDARNVIRGIAKNCRIHRTLDRSPLIEIDVAKTAS